MRQVLYVLCSAEAQEVRTPTVSTASDNIDSKQILVLHVAAVSISTWVLIAMQSG